MKKRRKFNTKILSFLLSLFMLFSTTGMNTVFAAGTGTIPTEIWVNGEDILQDGDKIIVCGGGTADYEESSNTLTLNDAVIDTVYQNESTGIFANGDLNIVVNGDCSITEDELDDFQTTIGIGIWATGSLIISGGGSLTINVKDAGVKASDISLADVTISVLCLSNSFYANGGTITVSSGDIMAHSTGNFPALWADTDLTISGGKVNATSAGSNGMGADGNLSISGTADVTAEGPYPGLFAASSISVSGGTVNATGTNDSGIFTRGTLSISGTADVIATGGLYCGLQADGAITISGGKVNATSSEDSAIYTPVSITVTGSPEITAGGYLRAMQTADLDISGGTINATSTNDSAITATTKFSITGDASVIANGKICALLAEGEMILSAKNIEAYSQTNYAVSNKANDIKIGGKLIAESQDVYAVRSFGNIITDSSADISATGGWGGIQANGDITFDGSKIEAVGNGKCGIFSTSNMSINSGTITAVDKGGSAGISSGGNLVITGGSVKATMGVVPQAENGAPVYKTLLTLSDVTDGEQINGLTIMGAGNTSYGTDEIAPMDEGKIYAYLPVGEAVASYDNVVYKANVNNTNESVLEGPKAVIEDKTISGIVGNKLTEQHLVITVSNAKVNTQYIETNNSNISGWIKNLPKGLKAELVNATEEKITLQIQGTPTETSSNVLLIVIPKEFIKEIQKDLTVTKNENTRFNIYRDTPVTSYAVTVNGGAGSGSYTPGSIVTITAAEPDEGKTFSGWTVVSGAAELKDAASETTTFSMPWNPVEVTANYDDVPTPTPEPVKVTGIKLAPSNLSLEIGNNSDLKAVVTPAEAENREVIWTSSNKSVVSVSASGAVTARKAGTATITCTAADGSGVKASGKVTVRNTKTPLLILRGTAGRNSVRLNWNQVSNADGYEIYGTKCGGGRSYKKVKTITNGTTKTWTQKSLRAATTYKYMIKAYKMINGKRVYLKNTNSSHVVTTGSKYTNAKSVHTTFTDLTLQPGKTRQVSARLTLVKSGGRTINHVAEFRYWSTNKNVATVTAGGKIKAGGKGKCSVYVCANNGMYRRILITVE